MEDENIFSYGPYKLYKDAFDVNIRENLDKYIRTAGLTSQEEQDFRAAVDFINQGIGSYITSMSGSGTFRDNKGYLKKDNRGHQHAAKYIHTIANKQGALGNATPKEKPLAEEPSKELFDPNKHFIGAKFETEYNPTGLDSDYSYWKGTANGTTLHEHLRNYIKTNYLDKGFDQYDFSKTNVTSDYYKGMLNSLYNSLEDGVSDDDIKKMQILGFKNPSAFKPVVNDPKLNENGQGNDPTADKTVLNGNDISAIQKAGFKIGNKNWLDADGNDTGISLDQDPRNTQQEQISEEDFAKEIETVESDIRGQLAPLFLTAYSIASPEPYTATAAGITSDFINYFNTEGNWLNGLGSLGANLLGTAAGIIPYVGDLVGNVPKWIKGLRSMRPTITRAVDVATVVAGTAFLPEEWEFLKESFNKVVGTDDGDWSTQDIVNVSKLLLSTAQIIKGAKDAKKYRNAQKQARLDPEIHVRVKGVKDGKEDIFVVSGDKAKAIKEAKTAEEVNSHLSDLGIKTKDLPLKDKEIYNPELVRQLTGDRLLGNKPRGHFGDKARGQMANRPAETPDAPSVPRTTGKPKLDDLRAKVEAKLKGEKGLTDDEVKEIDQLLRKLSEKAPKKSYKDKWNNFWGQSKPRKEYTDAKDALIEKGYTADQVDELLKGFFKQGGILKASTGIKINANDIDLRTYKGWEDHFNYDETNKVYSLKDGYNKEALTKWGTTNGLNITLPTQNYGSNYKYTPQNSLYKEGAISIGFKHANNANRSENLIKSPDNSDELDLNAHWQSRRMYNTDDSKKNEYNRKRDFIQAIAGTKADSRTLQDMLGIYNKIVDRMYAFKQSDKGITYTGSDTSQQDQDVEDFNQYNYNFYRSQNTDLLHGFDRETIGKNGSGTMGRSIDRAHAILTFTEDDFKGLDDSYYEGLKELLLNQTFTNDGTGRYYTGNADVTITKKEVEEGKEGEVSIPGEESTPIKANGDPLLRKKSPDLSPLFSAYNYYNSLKTNKDILDLSKKLPTLLYDPVEHHRSVYGNLRAVQEGQKQAAELRSMASKPLTSDGSLQMAAMMDAQNQGQKYVEAGLKADDEMMRQTSEAAWQQEKENKISRHQTAMKNRENMHQTAVTKLQAEASKKTADYQSTKAFVDELQKYYITKKAEGDKKQNAVYSLNLQRDIYDNPQNYMADWNSYHDGIWKRGIKGQPLGESEKQTFDELKQKAQQIYYNLLYYNTADVNTSVKDVAQAAADFSVIRALHRKKGGVIDVDLAKVILGYIKEANKNYNKAVDRSARGMYNYIKQQRKKK